MQIQKPLNPLCLDGRCPEKVDEVKKITLTPLEKRAIFFVLDREIERTKKRVEEEKEEDLL